MILFGLTVAGVATENNTMTAIGLGMVGVAATASGGIALASAVSSGATFASVVSGATMLSGAGSLTFMTAEIQEATGNGNWMLDAGMSEKWYNGLMLITAGIATFGTVASSIASSFSIKSIPSIGRFGKYGQKGYCGIKYINGAGKTRVLTFHTHSHTVGKTISRWHWQLQKWNSLMNEAGGTIGKWIWWNLTIDKN